jgi:hypothetical protein
MEIVKKISVLLVLAILYSCSAGTLGARGKDGETGQPGEAGQDGESGKDGTPGKAGTPGKDGKDGASVEVHFLNFKKEKQVVKKDSVTKKDGTISNERVIY